MTHDKVTKGVEKLEDIICKNIPDAEMTTAQLETVYKAGQAALNLLTIEAMKERREEPSGYSGRPHMTGRYGYSYDASNEHMLGEMREALDAAPNEHSRRIIHEAIMALKDIR